MAQKFVAPNTIFDSSVAFLKNVNLDSTIKFDSVTLSTIDTSAEGLSQLDTAFATSGAIKAYVDAAAGGKDEFNELLDVSVGTRTNNDLVRYNSTTSTWDNASLASLDIATITYVDSSLSARDTSIANLVTITTNLDTSIQALDVLTQTHTADIAQLDASIVRTDAYQVIQDGSIAALQADAVDGWNGVTRTDNSIGLGGNLNFDTEITAVGSGFDLTFGSGINTLVLDASNITSGTTGTIILQPTGRFEVQTGAAITLLSTGSGDVSIATGGDIYLDASSIFIDDVGIATVDTSTEGLSQLDTAIATSAAIRSYVNTTTGNYVKKTGDTMTGPLTITGGGLQVGTIALPQDVSIYSQLYVHNGATIGGDLIIDGSLFVRDVETIDVSGAFIKLNTGETGVPPASMQSGIIIDRGSELPYVFIYDESTQAFRVGIAPETAGPSYDDASTQAVATREDTPTADGIGFWNSTLSRIDTDASLTFSPDAGLSIGGPAVKISNLATDNAEFTGVLIDGANNLVIKEFGTGAFATIANYATITYVDSSLSARDTSIAYVDALAQDLSTNKLDAVATTSGAGGHDVYSGETDNIAYIKRIVAGSGATIISDTSTVTISVTGADGFMSKYTNTFDGTAGTTLSIAFGTHGITNDTSTLIVSAYDGNSQVFPEISVDAVTAEVTIDWTSGSLSANCRYIITG